MGCFVILGLAGLFFAVSEGSPSNPWDSWYGNNPFSWETLGVQLQGPVIGQTGTWHKSIGRAGPTLSPVVVQCQEASMVVTVKRDLFGTGKLIQANDLKLGAGLCRHTSVDADEMVRFQVSLQDCGNTLQMTPDYMVYNSILTYKAAAASSSAVITRSNMATVPIECVYPRAGNVSSKAIKPTWIPFSSTVSTMEKLAFSLRLMNDDWSSPRTSATFQLGQAFHIEASVDTGNNAAMRVFVESCVATLNPDTGSSPRYDIIGSNGCLIDGKLEDSSSAFMSPRSQQEKLRFTVDAFRFIGELRSTIYITCSLKAVAASQAPDRMNKACSYRKLSNGWFPVEGLSSICSCCEIGNCAGGSRSFPHLASRHGKRMVRAVHPSVQASEVAVLGPLVVLNDKPSDLVEDEVESLAAPDAVSSTWVVLGLVLAGSIVCLSLLGTIVLYKRCQAFT